MLCPFSLLTAYYFSLVFGIRARPLALRNDLNLAMQIARTPPADPAPATITTAFSMHTGHIYLSLNFYLIRVLFGTPMLAVAAARARLVLVLILIVSSPAYPSNEDLIFDRHELYLARSLAAVGVTSVSGFAWIL